MENLSALSLVADSLRAGLPVLLPQFLATLVLLAVGVLCYRAITPFRERRLVAEGNVAGGIVYGGSIVALAIPLAATLATSTVLLDIVLWGIIALIVQLIAFGFAALMLRDLRQMIEDGNVAAALALVGIQLAIALLNAGAMAG
jgi:putative membrane protein